MKVQYKYILWIQSLIQVLTVSLLNCISGYIVPSYNDNHHTLHDTLTQIPPLYIIIYTPTLHITYPKRHPYTPHTLNATPTHHIPYTQALHMIIPETPALHIPAPKHHIYVTYTKALHFITPYMPPLHIIVIYMPLLYLIAPYAPLLHHEDVIKCKHFPR